MDSSKPSLARKATDFSTNFDQKISSQKPIKDPRIDGINQAAGVQIAFDDTSKALNLILIYRPPRRPFSDADEDNTAKICSLINNLQGENIIVGDLNFAGIDWEALYSAIPGERTFLDTLNDKFM